MKCTQCGKPIGLKAAHNPCPYCGSFDREISVKDSGRALERLGLKARGNNGAKLFERKQGKKISKHGREVNEFLKFDHRNLEKTIKIHIVKERMPNGNWKVVHKEEKEYPAKHRPKKKI